MSSFLLHAQEQKNEAIKLIRSFVECESPSDSPTHVDRFVDLLIETTRGIAQAKTYRANGVGRQLRLQFKVGVRKKQGRILGLGHSDTVWPLGTLRSMPFRQTRAQLYGPGVLDMKAGLAFFIVAMRTLRDLDAAVNRDVVLLVVSDEETGSHHSRARTETEARSSNCVLVLEPGTGLDGKLKTARKGIGQYSMQVTGISSHAGVDFESGASAIVEAARQVERLAAMTDLPKGITVNPGVVQGGTRSNVVAAHANIDIDVRVTRLRDAVRIERQLKALRAVDRRCSVSVHGGLNRPPMERTRQIGSLFAKAQEIAASFGVRLQESATGGGSDGNFTAALGIPTLDGLGAVGEGAHASHESILVERIPDRIALLAGLLHSL